MIEAFYEYCPISRSTTLALARVSSASAIKCTTFIVVRTARIRELNIERHRCYCVAASSACNSLFVSFHERETNGALRRLRDFVNINRDIIFFEYSL